MSAEQIEQMLGWSRKAIAAGELFVAAAEWNATHELADNAQDDPGVALINAGIEHILAVVHELAGEGLILKEMTQHIGEPNNDLR
jgi:hypothetical protein